MPAFLLKEQTTNTTGTQDTSPVKNTTMTGKYYTITAYGTWGGATVTTKFTPDDGTTWIECGIDTTFTADGAGNLYLSPGEGIEVRGDLTGATGTTDLNLIIS